MVLVFFYRYHINFSKKQLNHSVLKLEKKEIMVLECFSSHRMSLKETVLRKCLKSLLKKKDLSFLDGEKFRLNLTY